MVKKQSLNFITKLILLLQVILLVCKGENTLYITIAHVFALVLIMLAGKLKVSVQSIFLVALLYGANMGFAAMPYESSYVWQAVFLPLQIIVLIFLYLILAFGTTEVEDLHAVLQFMHLPNSFILTVLIKIRFWQVAASELKNIRSAMHLRGLGKSPFKVIEQVYSPLLADSAKINDELAVCSYLHGMGAYKQTTPLRAIKFNFLDVVSVLTLLLIIALKWGWVAI